MQIKFKKLKSETILPFYSSEGDAAMDLTCISRFFDPIGKFYEYGFGFAMEVPDNHVALIFPRSSISNKELFLTNAVGVIDSKYRQEVRARFKATKQFEKNIYEIGDRIAQMIILPYPTIQVVEVDDLSKTNRGEGFGSSGK